MIISIDPNTLSSHFEPKDAEEKSDSLARVGGTGSTSRTGDPPTSSTPRRRRSRARCTSATSSATPRPTCWPATSGCAVNVFYPMGSDDNGLPTERRVQNYYHVRCEAHAP